MFDNPSFVPSPPSSPLRHHKPPFCSTAHPNPPPTPSRRALLSLAGALSALTLSIQLEHLPAAWSVAQTSTALNSLRLIRAKVDEIEPLISSARWDAIRTVLAAAPVVHARAVCDELLRSVSTDVGAVVIGLREDLLSAIRLLDTSVYSNVFVGEDRQVLGTKVDFEVPRIYLGDVKMTLDELIGLAEE